LWTVAIFQGDLQVPFLVTMLVWVGISVSLIFSFYDLIHSIRFFFFT
jgi:hypothetical protein